MKNLSKIPQYIWWILALILIALSGVTYWVLTMKIEQQISAIVTVSKTGVNKLLINANDLLYLKKKQRIRVRLKNKYYDVTIQTFENKNNGKIEITLVENVSDFVPGSTMPAKIIYSSIPVWQKILNR